jgi:hypothetical protein
VSTVLEVLMAGDETDPRESPLKGTPADPHRDDRVEDRAATSSDADRHTEQADETGTTHCDLCGAPMMEVHCKYVCVQCGYTRDCSDP